MNIFQRFLKLFESDTKITQSGGEKVSNFPPPGDEYGNYDLFGMAKLVYPKLGDGWKFQWLNEKNIAQTIDAGPLYKNILRYVPPVTRAFNAWRHGVFTEWTLVGSTPQMQSYIDNMLQVLEDQGSPFDTLLQEAASYAYWSGALFGEMVLNSETMEFEGFNLENPFRVRFKLVDDPERGSYYEFGIHDPSADNTDQFKSLEGIQTILYQIINPAVDEPYAEPFINPAVPPTIIFFPMLFDMRRAYKGQAMPRLYYIWDPQFFGTMGWTPEKVTTYTTKNEPLAKAKLDNLTPDKASMLPAGLTVTSDQGRMSRSAMDGVEMVSNIIQQMYAQALNIPATILSFNSGGALFDSKSADFRNWYKDLAAVQGPVEKFFSILITRAAVGSGIPGEAIFSLKRNDEIEIEREIDISVKKEDEKLKKIEVVTAAQASGVPIPPEYLESLSQDLFEEDPTETEDQMIGRAQLTGPQRVHRATKQLASCCDNTETRQEEEEHVQPQGADQELLPIVDPVINEAILASVFSAFDAVFDEYRGMLEANIAGQEPEGESNWLYYEDEYYFEEVETEEIVDEEKRNGMSDILINALFDAAVVVSTRLALGEIDLNDWLGDMRTQILVSSVTQYLLAKGGINNLNDIDRAALVLLNSTQYEFLQNFASDLAQGRLTIKQLLNRAKMYIEASTASYERGKAAQRQGLDLPEYPADGSQICRSNCKCHWDIRENEEQWEAYWTLDPTAEHCASCLDNARKWAPFIQTKVR